jgi:hypothetical protein
MDPNWFYSTLAQSTAAVVGLAGGFLFTWLLSRRGEVIVERHAYIDSLNRIIGKLEELKRRTDTVRFQTEEVLRKIRDQQAAGVSHDCLDIPQFELLSHPPTRCRPLQSRILELSSNCLSFTNNCETPS